MPRTTAAPLSSAPLAPGEPIACDLFCTVIDNFGDIGVSLRLACVLHRELGWQVHLWTDDVSTLRAICPDLPDVPCVHQDIHVRT